MHLIPNTSDNANGMDDDSDDEMINGDPQPHPLAEQVLVINQSGVLSLVTPVDELRYLRLNAMQTYLTAQLDHPCGLNPRGYRAVESDRMNVRGVVDGTLLRRWTELPKQRKVDACQRVGTAETVVRTDLEHIGGGGLGYL